MRSAIVYYSLEGNTETAAKLLAEKLDAQLFEIKTTKAYPKKGLAKFIVGGKDSSFGRQPQIEALDMDPADFDVVVLALPVWAGKAAAPVNTFIKEHALGSTKVGLVIDSASGDAASCAKDLAAKLGRPVTQMPTLSLKNPGKMDRTELDGKLDSFAQNLQHRGGGGAF